MRGIVAGTIGLSLFQLLVSNPAANKNAGTFVTLFGKAFSRLVDPNVPLIPDLRGGGTNVRPPGH